jgi:predicted ATPase
MNPRITDPEMYTNPNGTSKGIGVGAAIASRFKSHGEILKEYTVNGILDAKDSIILLDEPESALSLKNQFQLAKNILKVVKNDCQIIIATHCLPLIEEIGEVYSLEHNRWMKSDEFINLNKVG